MTARVDDERVDEPGVRRASPDRVGPITVEQAYRAKLRAAAEADGPAAEPARGAASPAGPGALLPGPPRPAGPARPPTAPPVVPPNLRARPRIEPEQGILGLSRHTRSRLGSRLFNLFFVCVFALIVVQMVVALMTP